MDKVEIFKQIEQAMLSLYKKKNKDYGDSFGKSFEEYGLVVSAIRIEDKLNRLKSLISLGDLKDIEEKKEVKDESVYDTLIDLANYSVMTLIELNLRKHI